jgi:UDP-N-acetylglucosamine pyrophosphorylase
MAYHDEFLYPYGINVQGGHLAKRCADGQLILRESAQCAKEDEKDFQDITKHKYFNTNNLWVRLDK